MKTLRYFIALVICSGTILTVSAQNINTSFSPGSSITELNSEVPPVNIYKREHIIPEKKPVPYTYIREADVMWAKDIWRVIDLRERVNITLRYPVIGKMEDRYSLFNLLMEGIRSEEITPYQFTSFQTPFKQPTNLREIYATLDADTIFDDNGNPKEINTNSQNIKQFVIQEKWFFDKQSSVMKVRIYSMSPVIFKQQYNPITGQMLPQVERVPVFVVYFPQCRRLLATHYVYNPGNDAQNISFDDLFFQRRFASTIVAESNIYGNRFVTDYLRGQDALMEADRIKNDLFVMEHDLWEY